MNKLGRPEDLRGTPFHKVLTLGVIVFMARDASKLMTETELVEDGHTLY